MNGKKPLSDYARYSAIGLQMGAFIVLCTLGGRWLDSLELIGFPVFTIVSLLLAVFGSMYYIIKQLK